MKSIYGQEMMEVEVLMFRNLAKQTFQFQTSLMSPTDKPETLDFPAGSYGQTLNFKLQTKQAVLACRKQISPDAVNFISCVCCSEATIRIQFGYDGV